MSQIKQVESLKLAEMPPEMHDLMKQFDADGSGGIGLNDLRGMVEAYRDSKRNQSLLQLTLLIVALALMLSSASTFGVSFAAVQLAKDTEPNSEGVIVLRGGGENRPALSPEFTITDGVETVHDGEENGLARRLQNGHAENQTSVTVVTITESKVAQACHLFHQGAASNLVIAIDRQHYRVSPTRFHDDCMTASGHFDSGVWNVFCPGDGEVCHASVILPQNHFDRRLERALFSKGHWIR